MATAFANIQDDYRPSASEPFMCDRQLDYFRAKLVAWKEEILRDAEATMAELQTNRIVHADPVDRASTEEDWRHELRARDRQRKLIQKIEHALRRIEDGEYGYCAITGEPISLARLEARPVATMTIEAQQRHERLERISSQA